MLEDVRESGLIFANEFGRGALERLFGGDAVDPALLGELFVAGEIEADEQFYGAVVFGFGGRIARGGSWLCFRFARLGFFRFWRLCFGRRFG